MAAHGQVKHVRILALAGAIEVKDTPPGRKVRRGFLLERIQTTTSPETLMARARPPLVIDNPGSRKNKKVPKKDVGRTLSGRVLDDTLVGDETGDWGNVEWAGATLTIR